LRINVDDLRAQPQRRLGLSFKESLEGLMAVKPVVGELSLAADAVGVRISGRLQTLLKLNCDRCLRPYFLALSLDLDERFVEGAGETTSRERELNHDDFVEPLPDDGMLDISDVVYQAVTLATPTYCLCGEECPGPPASEKPAEPKAAGTGGGSTVDPRWQNLKTLFPNDDPGSDS
jgi:uncharacterized metal-binding protein YceD (DUF177 family)